MVLNEQHLARDGDRYLFVADQGKFSRSYRVKLGVPNSQQG